MKDMLSDHAEYYGVVRTRGKTKNLKNLTSIVTSATNIWRAGKDLHHRQQPAQTCPLNAFSVRCCRILVPWHDILPMKEI